MPAFSGVYAAAITPRRLGPEIDLGAAFDLLDFLARAGVSGIALLGSTGEFPHFSLEERSRLVSLAVKRSRVPILAGVSHSTFDGALAIGREALAAGAAGLLLMPPYFFRYTAEDVRDFYLNYGRQLKDPGAVFLYNVPQFATPIPVETSIELLRTGMFAGIKDSSGDWAAFTVLQRARSERPFTFLAGHDSIYIRTRLEGGDGIISGVACAVPELLVALDRAVVARDAGRFGCLDARLQEFMGWVDAFPAPVAIREAAALRGVRTGPPAVPPSPESQKRLGEFGEWFRAWLPDVLKEAKAG